MVVFTISVNQIESLEDTVMEYFPIESVMVPLPEELITPTASRGRRADKSKTVPLMVTCWANSGIEEILPASRTTIKKSKDDLKKGVCM
jgi:hypothetical protein